MIAYVAASVTAGKGSRGGRYSGHRRAFRTQVAARCAPGADHDPRDLRARRGAPCCRSESLRTYPGQGHLAVLGVDVLIAERCLNHSLGGLVAVYDNHDYMAERRKALTLWSNKIRAIERGAQLVPLKLVASGG